MYHTIDAGYNADGSMSVIVYSSDIEIILDEKGAVLDLPFVFDENLAAGVYDIKLKNVKLSRVDATKAEPADYTFSVVVGSPSGDIALKGDYTGTNDALKLLVDGSSANVTGEVTMHGSYANNIMVTDANAYYIKNNKFWLNNQYFYIDAFRAYFTLAPSAAKSGCLTIGDTTTAIDTLINGDKVAGVWSTNGVMRNNVEKGMNIIKMADGKCVKVLVK